MKRVIVIGCPGAGKSTFARALRDLTGMPLVYLDRIWHKADRTTVTREEFDAALEQAMSEEKWIIDGNYIRTLEPRLQQCDTVFFLDYPIEVCLEGARSRVGVPHEDLPWLEEEFDPEFRQWIEDFPRDQLPRIRALLERCAAEKTIIVFHSREEAEEWLKNFNFLINESRGSMIKAVLFDLDGTLLPMDQDAFVHGYFKYLVKKMAPYGYDPDGLVKAIWKGTGAMVKNDGSRKNEAVFWDAFAEVFGEQVREHEPVFYDFYAHDFQQVQGICGFEPKAAEAVKLAKARGFRTVLATNPVFPAVATESRIRWAGLQPEDFELYTTYENIGFCKPNPAYYQEIIRRMDLKPQECLMVGNDVDEDMIAGKLGMQVFLLTDCLINKNGTDIDTFPHGNFDDLLDYLCNL